MRSDQYILSVIDRCGGLKDRQTTHSLFFLIQDLGVSSCVFNFPLTENSSVVYSPDLDRELDRLSELGLIYEPPLSISDKSVLCNRSSSDKHLADQVGKITDFIYDEDVLNSIATYLMVSKSSKSEREIMLRLFCWNQPKINIVKRLIWYLERMVSEELDLGLRGDLHA